MTTTDLFGLLFGAALAMAIWRLEGVGVRPTRQLISDPLHVAVLWTPLLLLAPVVTATRIVTAPRKMLFPGELIGVLCPALTVATLAGLFVFRAHSWTFFLYCVWCAIGYPLASIALAITGLRHWDAAHLLPWTHNFGIASSVLHVCVGLLFLFTIVG
jgi:hypothetical protein